MQPVTRKEARQYAWLVAEVIAEDLVVYLLHLRASLAPHTIPHVEAHKITAKNRLALAEVQAVAKVVADLVTCNQRACLGARQFDACV